MNSKESNFQSTYESVKSCLFELGFPNAQEVVSENFAKFGAGIQDEDFSMFIEIDCQVNAVNIVTSPDLAFEVGDVLSFYQILNELNLKLMDIGHLSFDETDNQVLLQASVFISDNDFNRDQFLNTMQRISMEGLELFRLLKEMFKGDECPLYLLHSYVKAAKTSRPNQERNEETIH